MLQKNITCNLCFCDWIGSRVTFYRRSVIDLAGSEDASRAIAQHEHREQYGEQEDWKKDGQEHPHSSCSIRKLIDGLHSLVLEQKNSSERLDLA